MIRELLSDDDVRSSFEVMRQLRPHLEEDEYVERVRRQRQGGYRLVAVEQNGVVRAVGGFRILEMLVQGKHLYIDDLVTGDRHRSKGHGALLLDWLLALAKSEGCATLELDSGVQRTRAHAFYFAKRLHISSYHFKIEIR